MIPQPTGGPGVTRFAARDGHRLSYESTGATEGVPVLALHDLLADRGQFRPLYEALSGADHLSHHVLPSPPAATRSAGTPPSSRERGAYRLTFPDARGHGASPMISSGRAYPAHELVADAVAILDAEGLDRVHIAAIGWGAATALHTALLLPERVESLVLAESYLPGLLAAQPDPRARELGEQHLEIVAQAADAALKGQTDRALDRYLGTRLGEGWRDGLPKARLGAIRRSAASLAPLLAGVAAERFEPETLRGMQTPVTVLVRENAPEFERLTAETLASLLPRVQVGHVAIAQEPESQLASGQMWTAAFARALSAHHDS